MLRKFPHYHQMDMADCGPACLKMIAKYYGKYLTLQSLREKCGISKSGVTLLDISQAAEDIGFRTLSIKCDIDDLLNKVPFPAIIHCHESHYIVVYAAKSSGYKNGVLKGKFFISDPAKGYLTYTTKDLMEKWYKKGEKKGVVMAIEKRAEFSQTPGENKDAKSRSITKLTEYFKTYRRSFFNLFSVMLIVTILQGFLPFISKSVIDIGVQAGDISFINLVLFANATIIVAVLLSNIVRDWILLHVTSRINIAMISDYLTKIMSLPINFFETKLTGDILQRAQDHDRIRDFLMNNSLNMIFSILTFMVFGVILYSYHSTLFFIFSFGSSLYLIWVLSFVAIRKKLDWEYFDLVSKNQSSWIEIVTGIQDIKINNYEKAKRWKWEGIQARMHKVNLRSLSVSSAQNLGAQFIESLKNLFITFYCAKAVINGEITFGVMISTQFIIGMLNGPVIQFVQFVISFQYAQLSLQRMTDIEEMSDESGEGSTTNITLIQQKHLILNNVSFQYNPSSPPVLKNLRLVIPENKITAIVGDSGSGKSTLIKLLLRLYKPSYGEICIGSLNIQNIDLKQWRNRCGAVMQDGRIFNDTILNNIVLDDEIIDHNNLDKALNAANIAYEIEQLPLGYHTVMGEQGRGLSGGQKQRILIARALYKNPDYLFFDEATNSLDSINEQKIVAALDEVFKDKTVIVIAHRLSTIIKADQIVVMRDGMIVEVGTHSQLMEHRGRYFELVGSQMASELKIS